MPLTDVKIRNAVPGAKTRRLFDGHGLYLELAPSGGKWWRLKYRIEGTERRISLGVYPTVTLREARRRCTEARGMLAAGIDPKEQRDWRRPAAAASDDVDSFEAVTRAWFDKQRKVWAPSHAATVIRRLERDVFPFVGSVRIGKVTSRQLLDVLAKVEARGSYETARRIRAICGQVFGFAIASQFVTSNPAAGLISALERPQRPTHFAAPTTPETLASVLRAIDGYEGSPIVRAALRLTPLVFVRPGELRAARWAEIDLKAARWSFEASKTDTPHIVPLARQAVDIFKEIMPLTSHTEFAFHSARSPKRPMSNNAINAALRRMGIGKDEATAHGFRATARTLLAEVLGFRAELVEAQLAHTVKDPLGTAYNRTIWIRDRTKMMQRWADYLDELRAT